MDQHWERICSEAGAISDAAERLRFLLDYPELQSAEMVTELTNLARSALRSNLPHAFALAEAAVSIAQQLSDDELLGIASRSKANALWFMGDCSSAVALFDCAAELLERAGNLSEVGRTLSSSLQARSLLGAYDDAMEAAARAREIFRELGETARIARLEINVANILHRQNRYSEALQAYQHAYQELLPLKDMEAISVALHNIAVCLIALDDYDNAESTYARARELANENDMPLLAAQADYNVAYLYHLRGEYSRCLDLLRVVKERCTANGDDYHVGLCDLDASGALLDVNLLPEAADAASRALEQFERLGMNYEIVRSKLNLAIALSLQCKSKEALDLFERAREQAAREENEVLGALIDLHSGVALLDLEQYSQVSAVCQRAKDVFSAAGIPSKVVACLLMLSRGQLESSDFDGATAYSREASNILLELDAPMLSHQAAFLAGEICEKQAENEAAFRHYEAARQHLEAVRRGLRGDEVKIGLMRNRVDVYTRLARLCLARERPDASAQTFEYMEAAKARALHDLVMASRSDQSKTPTHRADQARLGDLRKKLNWYYNLIEREQYTADKISQDRLSHLRGRALECERSLQRIQLESISDPAVSNVEQGRPATLADIQRSLGKHTTILEYFAIDDEIYAAVVRQDDFSLNRVARESEISAALRLLQFQISKLGFDPGYVEKFETVLQQSTLQHLKTLYEALIRPIADRLLAENLVIVPYGNLHALPFAALFDGSQFLVDQVSISYAPCASLLAHARGGQKAGQAAKSLIVGVEDPSMPSIKQEVEQVASSLPNPRVLWGREATEDNLRRYGSDSTYIHIASHGFFRPDNPVFSAIRLSDSYLTMQDLYRMQLPAEFLALSGCVTGLNLVEQGDELIGLTRGLLYSGARRLLVSLWEVSDRSTAEYIEMFYRRYPSAVSPAEALRSAMLEMRAIRPHPYHWAAFKLIVSVPTVDRVP